MEKKPKKLGDPTVKVGDKIDINGIPVEIVDQDQINESADKGDMVFTVLPISMGRAAIPNCRVVKCDDCGCDCWMSPATYSTWQPSGAPICCIVCVTKRVEAEKAAEANKE